MWQREAIGQAIRGSGMNTSPQMRDAAQDRPGPSMILSLRLDLNSFNRLDAWRERHFPPALNHLSAHLTLFHKLGGQDVLRLEEWLKAACRRPPIPLFFTALQPLGRGVAVRVDSPELLDLRTGLARAFPGELTPQDRQGFRPHVTIQNKVHPAEARDLLDRLNLSFESWSGVGEGLLLWRYLGGPWSLQAEYGFQAG